jgi:hypothetical protein
VQALTALTTIISPFGDSGKAEPAAPEIGVPPPLCDRRKAATKSCPAAAKTATLGFIAEYLARSCVDVREASNSEAPIGEVVHFHREV